MQRHTLARTPVRFWAFLLLTAASLFAIGCDWNGNIYLDEDTGTDSNITDSETDPSSTDDTNTESEEHWDSEPNPPDSESDSDSNPDWLFEDELWVEVIFPMELNFNEVFPDELCGNIYAASTPDISPYTPPLTKSCIKDPWLNNGMPFGIRFDGFFLSQVTSPVIVTATLFINTSHGDDTPDRGEDYWGRIEHEVFIEPGMGRRDGGDIMVSLIPDL